MVEEIIERMDRWLAKNRPEYFAILQTGATNDQLNVFEAQFSFELPAAFRQLYRWRNGQSSMSSASLQMNWSFLTLAEIADTKELLDGMIGHDFDDPRYWRRGWVPFLHNGGGSYLCLDLTAEDGGERGQLLAFWKANEDRPVEFPNMEAWLSDLIASMEDGSLEVV